MNDVSKIISRAFPLMGVVTDALTVFEKTGRREQIVSVCDQIEAFEKEWKTNVTVSKEARGLCKDLRRMIEDTLEGKYNEEWDFLRDEFNGMGFPSGDEPDS